MLLMRLLPSQQLWRCLAAVLGFALPCAAALAQAYPNKPIKAIVPFAPGSATDTIGRAFAAKMSEELGQQIITIKNA